MFLLSCQPEHIAMEGKLPSVKGSNENPQLSRSVKWKHFSEVFYFGSFPYLIDSFSYLTEFLYTH